MLRFQARAGMVLARAAAAVALVAALSACTSLEDATPQAQPVAQVATTHVRVSAAERPTGPVNTGSYPTFSGPLTAANVQMDNDDAAKVEARLTALSHQRQAGTVSEAEYQRRLAELRRLASEHGTAAEAEIAN